jgi:flagellar biosynthesis protein FliQ
MTSEGALTLMTGLLRTAVYLTGPALLASLAAGLLVGLAQTATQVNEASVSFLVKVMAVVLVLVAVGPALGAYAVTYTRTSLQALEHVVH